MQGHSQKLNKQPGTVRSILAILFFSLLFSLPMISQQQDISEYEKRLQEIAGQIENLKSKLKEEEKRESYILARLGRLGLQKRLIKNEISLYNVQSNKANSELNAIKAEIPKLKVKLAKEKDSVQKILVTLYKFGKFNYFELMLQVDNIGTLLSENKRLTVLAQYQENIITGYLDTIQKLKNSEERLGIKKNEINQLLQNSRHKQQELEIQEKKNQALIREIMQNKDSHLQALSELQERAEQLQSLMKKLLEEKIQLPFPLIPLYEKQGALAWPISGRVVTRFGNIRHPRFNTITKNNGIEIAPSKDMVVKSIHQGIIVYADYFEGYGKLIIVDHGMAYYTLYGHCSDFLAKKGDAVSVEQPIAIVGDISSMKGTTLYFEIRYKTKALNPLQWLQRR